MLRRLLLACLCTVTWGLTAHATEDAALARYDRVEIALAKTSIYVGSVGMTPTPFLRKNGVYHSAYHAKVFPYFFWNEQGWIKAIEICPMTPCASSRRARSSSSRAGA